MANNKKIEVMKKMSSKYGTGQGGPGVMKDIAKGAISGAKQGAKDGYHAFTDMKPNGKYNRYNPITYLGAGMTGAAGAVTGAANVVKNKVKDVIKSVKNKKDGQGGPGSGTTGQFFDPSSKYAQPRSAFDKAPLSSEMKKPSLTPSPTFKYPDGGTTKFSNPGLTPNKSGGSYQTIPSGPQFNNVKGAASKAVSPSRFPSLSKPAPSAPADKRMGVLKDSISTVQKNHDTAVQPGDTHTVSSTIKKAPKEDPSQMKKKLESLPKNS